MANDGTNWVSSDVPVNVGKYRVTIYVVEDLNYKATSSIIEFEIEEANKPSIEDSKPNHKNTKINTGATDQISLFVILGMLSLGIITFITGKKRKDFNK